MFSYETYKLLHIALAMFFLASLAISFCGPQTSRLHKILSGIASLLIFVAGMGLMARLGIGHGGSWPLWIKAKMTLWLFLAIAGPVLAKRIRFARRLTFFALFSLFILATYFAIYKLD